MNDEMNDWLEQECREFESQFFSRGKVWRSPANTLEGTELYSLFETFARTFPDHASDINTVFYLTETAETRPSRQQMWLRCSHFEHATLEDLRNLVSFIDDAMRVVSTTHDCAGVEMLDNVKEQLLLVFYTPKESVVEAVKSRGVQVELP